MSEFKPGDMVECVDADGVIGPILVGGIYTVSAVSYTRDRFGEYGVQLREVRAAIGVKGFKAFAASRFRLIKPRATDISIFREIVKEAMETGKVTA